MVIGEITEEQTAIAVAHEGPVVTELDIKELGRIEDDAAASIEIILRRDFERLVKSGPRHCPVLIDPLPDEEGSALLVLGEIGLK